MILSISIINIVMTDGAIQPDILNQSNNKFTIKHVPIFLEHKRGNFEVDSRYMRKIVEKMKDTKKTGFLARLITGHTNKGSGEEKPIHGYLDNFEFNEATKTLYSDWVDVDKETIDKLKNNQLPNRSCEIIPSDARIVNLSLLSSSPPYFDTLADIRYQKENETIILYSLYKSNGDLEMENKERDTTPGFGSNEQAPIQDDVDAAKWTKYMDDYCSKNMHKLYASIKNYESSVAKITPDTDPEPAKKTEIKEPSVDKKDEKPVEKDKDSKEVDDVIPGDKDKSKEKSLPDEYKKKDKEKKEYETSKWILRYQSIKAPATAIDIDKTVDLITSLPEDKQELFYQMSIKNLPSGPAEMPENKNVMDDVKLPEKVKDIDPVITYMKENNDRLHGDYAQALIEYSRKSKVGLIK